MEARPQEMNPQDIVILLYLTTLIEKSWKQSDLSESLQISQSEISKSLMRSKYASLIDYSGKEVNRLALFDFIKYGIRYVFPQQPGSIVRGLPTAHSAIPLNKLILSTEPYVWPSAKGTTKGQSILPLYPSVVNIVTKNQKLYELLALVDAIRVGKAREFDIATKELKSRILYGE